MSNREGKRRRQIYAGNQQFLIKTLVVIEIFATLHIFTRAHMHALRVIIHVREI